MSGPIGDRAAEAADRRAFQLYHAFVKSVGRGAEDRDFRCLGQAIDLNGIAERASHGFVDEKWFAGLDYRAGLFQVRPAIDAFDQDRKSTRLNSSHVALSRMPSS